MSEARIDPSASSTPDPGPETRRAERADLSQVKRVVVKVGTRVLSDGRHFDRSRVDALAAQIAPLASAGCEVLLVSSGAVGLGAELLGLKEPPERLEDRQACAAVGQAQLIQLYQESLRARGALCAQVLLTESDFHERRRYLNLRATLHNLLRRHVVPVINENDTVSVDELVYLEQGTRPVFGDNDRLSALVATKLDAQLLIIVTDVGGLYDRDPKIDPDARLLDRVDDPEALANLGTGPATWGRGGMRTKIEAAQMASRAGCHAVIASGSEPEQILRVLRGEQVGTWFPPRNALGAFHRWLAFAARSSAALYLDSGAVDALRYRHRSLLAAGVRRIEGTFHRGDVVEIRTEDGRLIGRGMTACDVETAHRWGAEGHRAEKRREQPLVRRERMVLEEWARGSDPEAASAAPQGVVDPASGDGGEREA